MKYLLALSLLFFSALADADGCTGVIVQSGGVVIAKETYCGDVSGLPAQQSARKAQDGTLTFTNSTPPDAAYTSTQIPPSATVTALSADATTINAAVKTPLETAIVDVLKKNGLLP